MSRRKSLHRSDEPVSSITFGAAEMEEEHVEIEMTTCPMCGKQIAKDRFSTHERICLKQHNKLAKGVEATPTPKKERANLDNLKQQTSTPKKSIISTNPKSKALFFSNNSAKVKRSPIPTSNTPSVTPSVPEKEDSNESVDTKELGTTESDIPQPLQNEADSNPNDNNFTSQQNDKNQTIKDKQQLRSSKNKGNNSLSFAHPQKLIACRYCERTFVPERIERHEAVCQERPENKMGDRERRIDHSTRSYHFSPSKDISSHSFMHSSAPVSNNNNNNLSLSSFANTMTNSNSSSEQTLNTVQTSNEDNNSTTKVKTGQSSEEGGEKGMIIEQPQLSKEADQTKSEIPTSYPSSIKTSDENIAYPATYQGRLAVPTELSAGLGIGSALVAGAPGQRLPPQLPYSNRPPLPNPSVQTKSQMGMGIGYPSSRNMNAYGGSGMGQYELESQKTEREKTALCGIQLYTDSSGNPSSCIGEVIYNPQTTTVSSFLSLVQEQLGLTLTLGQLRKNGYVPLQAGQFNFHLSTLLRSDRDYFSIIPDGGD